MAQQTAVEWLIEKITESGHLWLIDKPYSLGQLSLIIEQAKQMEKEQIIMAHVNGSEYSCDSAEQYYTETYGKD